MKKIIIELGSNYTHKDGTSCADKMLEKFKAEHPNAIKDNCFDLRKHRLQSGTVYDLYVYDYYIGKYLGNSYRRKYARYIEK